MSRSLVGSVGRVRRVSPVDLMLLGTVLLWALNITVTRYVLTHGWRPLSYGTIRYFAATALFWCFTYWREGSFRVRWRDIRLVGAAALLIFLNQLGFVYSVDLTSASTVALILGTTPIFVGLVAALVGLERMGQTFWLAAAIAIVGSSQTVHQSFHFGGLVWICFGYAVIGPLFLTNILWFTAIDRVGPSRAALFANLQPFLGVVIALLLLSEHLNRWEIVGGVAIFTAIVLERLRRPELRQSETDVAAEAPRP